MIDNTKIVEVIGPPAIGKSKLYAEVCRKHGREDSWIPMELLLAPKNKRLANPLGWMEDRYRILFGKSRLKSIPMDFGMRFMENHEDFASFCWDHLTKLPFQNSPARKFRSAYLLFMDFCRYQAIIEKKHPVSCLIEEGFLQKSFLVFEDKRLMEDILNQYLSYLPLPHAVIAVNSEDKSLILDRIKNRKKIIASHRHKSDAELLSDIDHWQFLIYIVLDKLQSRGVRILRLDGAVPLKEKVNAANNFLKAL